MELNKHFEVYLHFLTSTEFLLNRNRPEVYAKEYENYVLVMLEVHPEYHWFIEDIVSRYRRYDDQPIEEIFEEHPGLRQIGDYEPHQRSIINRIHDMIDKYNDENDDEEDEDEEEEDEEDN